MIPIAELEGWAREGNEGDSMDHGGMEGQARGWDEGDYTDHGGMEGWTREGGEGDYMDQTVNKAIKLGPSEVMVGQG